MLCKRKSYSVLSEKYEWGFNTVVQLNISVRLRWRINSMVTRLIYTRDTGTVLQLFNVKY